MSDSQTSANNKDAKTRVYGFVDGFNLYHALDNDRFRPYKWLCLTSLLRRYINAEKEDLVSVEYFTAYPTWDNDKRRRHELYVSAQMQMGVHITFGQFKTEVILCRGACKQPFDVYKEKQTDANISVSLLNLADQYDKAILLTGDSDQVPAVELLKKLYPKKKVAVLPPVNRKCKELVRACHEKFHMTEEALRESQLPNPLPIIRNGKSYGFIVKPTIYSSLPEQHYSEKLERDESGKEQIRLAASADASAEAREDFSHKEQ